MTIKNDLRDLDWTAEVGSAPELLDTATKALNEVDRIESIIRKALKARRNIIMGSEEAANFNQNIARRKERKEALQHIANKALARYDSL